MNIISLETTNWKCPGQNTAHNQNCAILSKIGCENTFTASFDIEVFFTSMCSDRRRRRRRRRRRNQWNDCSNPKRRHKSTSKSNPCQLRLWVSTISCSTNDHQSACQPFGNQFNFHYKALSARFFLQETIVAIKCYHIPKKIMLHITLHICEGGFHLWYPEWNMTAAESSFAYKTVQQETV